MKFIINKELYDISLDKAGLVSNFFKAVQDNMNLFKKDNVINIFGTNQKLIDKKYIDIIIENLDNVDNIYNIVKINNNNINLLINCSQIASFLAIIQVDDYFKRIFNNILETIYRDSLKHNIETKKQILLNTIPKIINKDIDYVTYYKIIGVNCTYSKWYKLSHYCLFGATTQPFSNINNKYKKLFTEKIKIFIDIIKVLGSYEEIIGFKDMLKDKKFHDRFKFKNRYPQNQKLFDLIFDKSENKHTFRKTSYLFHSCYCCCNCSHIHVNNSNHDLCDLNKKCFSVGLLCAKNKFNALEELINSFFEYYLNKNIEQVIIDDFMISSLNKKRFLLKDEINYLDLILQNDLIKILPYLEINKKN